MIKSPCKNCDKRYLGCHSECGKYTMFAVKRKEENDTIKKKRYENYLLFYK